MTLRKEKERAIRLDATWYQFRLVKGLPLLKFCQYFIRGELCHVVLLQTLPLSDFCTPKNIIYLTDRIFARLPASYIGES